MSTITAHIDKSQPTFNPPRTVDDVSAESVTFRQDQGDNISNRISQDSSMKGRTRIHNIEITFKEEHLTDQFENLQEEFDLSHEEARIIWNSMNQLVTKIAKDEEKNWSEEVIDGVTNLMISMFIQEEKQKRII